MPRFRLKTIRLLAGPLGGEVEVKPGEREILHPLFVVLRDRRALLYAPHGREDNPYVRESIEQIRSELTTALQKLEPDSRIGPRLEVLRRACREYLDATLTAGWPGDSRHRPDFAPALAELRGSFREVAEAVGESYRLPVARELAEEMRRTDENVSAGTAVQVSGAAFLNPMRPPRQR